MSHVGLEFYNERLYPGEWLTIIQDPINIYMGKAVRMPSGNLVRISKDFLTNLLADPDGYFGWKIGKGPKEPPVNIF